MSKVSEAEKQALKDEAGDSEGYHGVFDDLLESKLAELDPEYMAEMKQIYGDSGEARWCA